MTVTRQEYNRLQAEAVRHLKQLEQRHGTRENALAVTGCKNLAEFVKWRAYALFCDAHGLNLNDGTPTPQFIQEDTMQPYNDNLSAEDQIDCEEALHQILFESADENGVHEEDFMELAKRCTHEVLRRFGPDLFGQGGNHEHA